MEVSIFDYRETQRKELDNMSEENIGSELNFSAQLLEQMAKLHLDAKHSDITFVVDGVKLPAHKCILDMRSSYFNALISGG